MSAVEQHHVQALRILAKHDVPFVLIGGFGLQAHGFTGLAATAHDSNAA